MRSNHKCVTLLRIIQLQIINFKSATNVIVNNDTFLLIRIKYLLFHITFKTRI